MRVELNLNSLAGGEASGGDVCACVRVGTLLQVRQLNGFPRNLY